MAQRQSKAQVAAKYRAAGIMPPKVKMSAEELAVHVRQRSNKFASAKGKAARSRSNTRRAAIAGAY